LTGERIVSNKGEYEGATYAEEKRAYADWRYHVTLIAAYRVAMLDSRMRKVEELYLGSSGGFGHGQKVFFDDEKMDISGLVEMCRTQWIMIPDDTEWETEEAYRQALRDQMDHHFWVSHANCEHPETPYFENGRDVHNRRHYEETNSLGPETAVTIADTVKEIINTVEKSKNM
jgi:hypothetical protein